MNRRSFIQTGIAGSAALLASKLVFADDANPYAPFNMGTQSYSIRHWKTFDEVLAKVKEIGVTNIEFTAGHLKPTTDQATIDGYKKKLADAGLKAMAWGVQPFNEDIKGNRAQFEFAHAMGLYCISADFDRKALVSLDRLCEEFSGVHIGIHNHGPGHRYSKPEDVLDVIKDHHKNIGATADLGHYIRSKQDPLEVIEKLKDRLYGIHFKDFKDNGKGGLEEVIPGDGNLKVKETLALLKKIGFKGCLSLEYERNPQDPIADMKVALERVRTALKEI